jgi:hypothetical protein
MMCLDGSNYPFEWSPNAILLWSKVVARKTGDFNIINQLYIVKLRKSSIHFF